MTLEESQHTDQVGENPKEYSALNILPEQWRLKALFLKAGYAKAGDFIIEPTYKLVSKKLVPMGMHDTKHAKEIESELLSLGFRVKYITDPKLNGRIYFANSENDLNNLTTSERSDPQIMSQLYGIPETAIQAYPYNLLDYEQIPDSIKNHPLYETLPFMLSKEHFRDEWKQYRDRVSSLGKLMPDLVKQLQVQDLVSSATN